MENTDSQFYHPRKDLIGPDPNDLDYLLGKKRKRSGRICTPKEFKSFVQGRRDGLVRTHDLSFGIPQGTPLSGLYANIFMRSFDNEMIRLAEKIGGSYRRYSDDIAIVLPLSARDKHVMGIIEKILADYSLTLSDKKTEIARFEHGKLISEKPIQYLGFTFDGKAKLIRDSSLDVYRAKMRRGIHAKLVAAKKQKIEPSEIFKRELLSRYTHLGRKRNFIKYAYTASRLLTAPEIKGQVKNHMTWFNRIWNRELEKLF